MPTQTTRDAVMKLIQSELRESGVDEVVDGSTRFSDLDIDSLDAAEMMGRIKDEFGVELPRQVLSDATVDFLIDRVTSPTPGL